MNKRLGVALAALALAGCGAPVRYAVLGSEQDGVVTEQCSRPNPPRHEGSWVPLPEDIKHLEEDLPGLDALAKPDCCGGRRVGDPQAYLRQYFGIVSGGRRLIYVNAFLAAGPNTDWKQSAVVICDGGSAAWGAVYNPQARRFAEFAFNGG
jgi:hypothetical protein